jgi:hypothetical protein
MEDEERKELIRNRKDRGKKENNWGHLMHRSMRNGQDAT